MDKENLFNLIRKEEVIIWAGAGLSKYAGYPSGKELCKILFDNLSKTEQKQIDPNLLLPDLAEEFYRLKGENKNSLISILKKVFVDFIPITTAYHDKLATIPHFKTIITTNFDQLIENSFGNKGQCVYATVDIPYLENSKTHIFKAHGDLSERERIIITRSDYNRFYKENKEYDIYWTAIKNELATKCVLFLGYDLEDTNTSVIFDKIYEVLSTHRKEWFLVSPDLKQHKINYLYRKGIQYINSTAEKLIEELIVDLEENIIDDFDKGATSADTFRSFLLNYNLLPVLKANPVSFKLQTINGINGPVEGKMNLTLKNDKKFINELKDFYSGKNIEEIEIPEDKIIKTDFSYGGLKIPQKDVKPKLLLKRLPSKTTNIDVRFEDGFEFSDIPVKLYESNLFIQVHFDLKSAYLKIKMERKIDEPAKFTIDYEHNKICSRIRDEIELFNLLKHLGSGGKLRVFEQSKERILKTLPPMPQFLDESNYFLSYFESLRIIEQCYNIRFINIGLKSITNSSRNLINKAVSIINGENFIAEWDEFPFELMNEKDLTTEEIVSFNEGNFTAVAYSSQEEEIEIHGHTINLGFQKIEIFEAFISNVDSFLNKEENILRVKSKTNKIIITYTKTKEIDISALFPLSNKNPAPADL